MFANNRRLSSAASLATRRLSAAALALAAAASTNASELVVSQGQAIRALVVRQSGPIHHLTADCTGKVRPDRVVIAGAMTAEAVKPLDAQAQLDRQLEELRKYVGAENGRLNVLERVRAARTMRDRGNSRDRNTLPFLALQRLEIEFPATVAIDAAFERLLYLGLDRFGSNIRVDRVDRKRRVAVRYRFSALRDELDRLHARCRADAMTNWCAADGTGLAVCALPVEERDARVKTQALNLGTQQLLNERGGSSRYSLNYPWRSQQMARIEPIGDIAVEFQGTLQLQIFDIAQ